MTHEQSFRQLQEVIAFVQPHGVALNVSLSCSFGCPMEGVADMEELFRWGQRFVDLGMHGITLCDTTGMVWPTQVARLCGGFKERWESTELTLHFHNTRGMGRANAVAAIDAGVDRFDASLGGLGGCPAPGATGNLCMEDFAHMLDLMGYDTGVDIDALLGHEVPGQVAKAGRVSDLYPKPEWFAGVEERAHARSMHEAKLID